MKNKILFIGLAALAAVSCMKDLAPDATLGVQLAEGQYKVGEPVTFKFEGDPDNIVFYSGENGHKYENRHRTEGDCDIFLDFKTFVRANSASVYDNLRILVSTDFNGVYDYANVEAATWTDLTDKFRFSKGDDNYPGGELKLNEYAGDGKFFIAFKYTGKGNQWIVRTADVSQVTPEGVENSLGSMSTMGWMIVDYGNPGVGVDTKNLTRLYFDGNVAGNGEDNCDWVISKPLDTKSLVPDSGTALKNLSTTMSEFEYVYNEPGTYKAVFETSSVWYEDSKYSLTEVEVEVVGNSSVEPDPVPGLAITADKSEYTAGETATFTLSGNGVSNITLWTGDAGHDWEERDNYDRTERTDFAVKFESFVRYGVPNDNLQFLVSTTYAGDYTTEGLNMADWIDLSDYLTFPPVNTSGTANWAPSGEIRLNDYIDENDSNLKIYMAFRYTNTATQENQWGLRNLTVNSISTIVGSQEIANMKTMEWKAIDCSGDNKWSLSNLAQPMINGKKGKTNDDWIISKAFDRGSIAIGPDKGEAAELGTKTHVFKTAGIYTVVVDYFDGKSWKQATTTVTVK